MFFNYGGVILGILFIALYAVVGISYDSTNAQTILKYIKNSAWISVVLARLCCILSKENLQGAITVSRDALAVIAKSWIFVIGAGAVGLVISVLKKTAHDGAVKFSMALCRFSLFFAGVCVLINWLIS